MEIVLQNPSSRRQRAWVYVTLPSPWGAAGGMAVNDGPIQFPFVADQHGIRVLADLAGGQKLRCRLTAPTDQVDAFRYSDWVADEVRKLIPRFICDGDATGSPAYDATVVEGGEAHQTWRFRTRLVAADLTIDGWVTFFSGQDVAEFRLLITAGTVAGGTLSRDIGSVRMLLGERPVVDFATRKGLDEPIWRNDLQCWDQELVAPRPWSRAQRVRITGAILCAPPYSRWAEAMALPGGPERAAMLEARKEAPLCGVFDGWGKDGNGWLAFGVPPIVPANAPVESQRRWASMVNGLMRGGDEYDQRPYCQTKNSGQTGEHYAFGATHGEEAIVRLNPYAIWDMGFSADGLALRPTGNREVNGDQVLAANHPRTVTSNQRPDHRFSAADMLGWPNPVPYSWAGSGYTTDDGQHRADVCEIAYYALTRDPTIGSVLADLIQLDLMAPRPVIGSPFGSDPRSLRTLMSQAHLLSVGMEPMQEEQLRLMVERTIDFCYAGASMRRIVQDDAHSVRVLSDTGSKYGWVNPDGTKIRMWSPWQESIACMALYAAGRQTADVVAKGNALALALDIARTICRHAFFQASGRWFSATWGVRWRTDDPGMPLPDSAYSLVQPNFDVYLGGPRWLLPALRILRREAPNDQWAERANEIIVASGPPQTWDDSCWWAVDGRAT